MSGTVAKAAAVLFLCLALLGIANKSNPSTTEAGSGDPSGLIQGKVVLRNVQVRYHAPGYLRLTWFADGKEHTAVYASTQAKDTYNTKEGLAASIYIDASIASGEAKITRVLGLGSEEDCRVTNKSEEFLRGGVSHYYGETPRGQKCLGSV